VGKGMTEGQVERRLLSLTRHLSHFITKSSMTNSTAAFGEGEGGRDKTPAREQRRSPRRCQTLHR